MARLFRKRGDAATAATTGVDGDPPALDEADADPAPGKRRLLGPVQIIVVIMLLLGALYYARSPGRDNGGPPVFANAQDEDPLPIVDVTRPVPSPTVLKVVATGTVNVRNYVALTPQVGGRVVSISSALRAGGAFSADQELLVIDPRDFELALDQARADIAAAQSNLMLQRAQSDAARSNYALLHPNENVPPLVARVPQIAQAIAQLSAARARTEVATLDLKRTNFSLPFDGRIAESSAEIGQVLSRGQSFGRAFALDSVEVVVPIAANDLHRIEPATGRVATVRTDTGSVAATVERVSAELDQRTRFAELYLTLAEAAPPPPPGTFVDVVIEGPEVTNAFLLPPAAEQVNRSVWVVADGALERVMPTTLGNTADGWLVAAFDAKDGVVLGAVPGAEANLPVDIGGDARGRFSE